MSTQDVNNNNSTSTPSTTELSFFNYHEFLFPQTKYSLVINHFPNNYTTLNSNTYLQTRIIRIPRCYSISEFSDLIPQFSLFFPGKEPGAISQEHANVKGTFDNNSFGITSGVPLEINHDELESIVKQVNEFCYYAFNPYSIPILLENIVDLITGGLFTRIFSFTGVNLYTKRKLFELEQYITTVNSKFKARGLDIVIISPRKSGYLSLDIQISKPNT